MAKHISSNDAESTSGSATASESAPQQASSGPSGAGSTMAGAGTEARDRDQAVGSGDAAATATTAAPDTAAPDTAAPDTPAPEIPQTTSTTAAPKTPDASAAEARDAPPAQDKPIATTTSAPAASSGEGESRSPTRAKKPADRKKLISSANQQVKAGSDAIRGRIASLVWLLAVLAALILAGGALLYALHANRNNAIVGWVLDAAGTIDGPFWRIFQLNDATKNHLVNWGLAAIAYLIVGRIADRVIRP